MPAPRNSTTHVDCYFFLKTSLKRMAPRSSMLLFPKRILYCNFAFENCQCVFLDRLNSRSTRLDRAYREEEETRYIIILIRHQSFIMCRNGTPSYDYANFFHHSSCLWFICRPWSEWTSINARGDWKRFEIRRYSSNSYTGKRLRELSGFRHICIPIILQAYSRIPYHH